MWQSRLLLASMLTMLPAIGLAADRPIVLGMSAAFKGPSRALGIELYRGSMAYFEQVNRRGGVHGHKITIKAYDDGYQPDPAVNNTIRLIEDDHVFALYGYVGTPTVTRVLPLLRAYADQSCYLFFPFTGAKQQRRQPYSNYVFNLRTSYENETGGLVDHLAAVGRQRIGILYQCDAYGRDGWEGVRKSLGKHGLQLAGEATYRRGNTFVESMRPQATYLHDAGADAVICIGSYEPCAAFVRDARDAGWDVPIANISFVGSAQLLQLLLQAGRDRHRDYTADLINSQVVPSYEDQDLPAIREYRALMEHCEIMPPTEIMEPGYQPMALSYISLEGFLNAKCLVKILEDLGPTLDPKRLLATVEAEKRIELGIETPLSFGPNRHQGLDEVYFTTVRGDRFIPLSTDWSRWQR